MSWVKKIIIFCTIKISLINCYDFPNYKDDKEKESDDFNMEIHYFASIVIQKYFTDSNCIDIIVDKGANNYLNLILDDIQLTFIAIEVNNEDTCDKFLDDILFETFQYNCHSYLVQTVMPECILKSWKRVAQLSLARHYPKFLFLPIYSTLSRYVNHLFSIREAEMSANILGVEIETLEDDRDTRRENASITLNIFTNNFYVQTGDDDSDPSIFINKWNSVNGFENDTNLYPDKVLDLRNKRVRLATWTYPPYNIYEPIDGTEARFIIEFCKKHNCNLTTTIMDDSMWGYVFDNGTGNGVMGQVYTDIADFGTSGLYLWAREYQFLEYSTPYLHSGVTCLVPAPKPAPAWITPFLPFNSTLWVFVFMSTFLAAYSIHIITILAVKYTRFRRQLRKGKQFFTIPDSLIRALGLLVLQSPSSRMIGSTPSRHLFTSFEILFYFLASLYGAGLASILTVPLYYQPIDTIKDLLDSGMYWLADHEAWVWSLLDVPDPNIELLASRVIIKPFDELIEMGLSGKYAVAIERLPAGHSPEEPHVIEEVILQSHIMKEDLYGAPTMIVMQKGCPYAKYLDKLIRRILDSGIYLFWEGDVARKYLSSRKQSALQQIKSHHHADELTELGLKHVQGIFYLYFLGLILSFIVFILEFIFFYFKKRSEMKKIKLLYKNVY